METNVRIVAPGLDLYLDSRCANIKMQESAPDLLQRTCGVLSGNGLAAIPCPDGIKVLVATSDPIPAQVHQGYDWRVEVNDSGQERRLRFRNSGDRLLLAQLTERCFLIEVARRSDLWTLDSPRIWYERTPFKVSDNFAAYRRFEVSAVPIEGVGVGIAVDVSTAFFTNSTIADFFRTDVPKHDQLRIQFESLSQRQQGQKATLLYDLDRSKHKCYFEEFLEGVNCGTTGALRVQGYDYPSLLEYYREKHPYLKVDADDPVARVSFPRIDYPQRVAANKLRLRVMNEALPGPLKQVDKISPADRAKLIDGFWAKFEKWPLGRGRPPVENHFWHPSGERALFLKSPDLMFAGGRTLPAPSSKNLELYREYYKQRRKLLHEVGCLRVPPAVSRDVYFALPEKGEAMAKQLTEDITRLLSKWTKKPISPTVISYKTLDEALRGLRREARPSVVVFVFEAEDPATYFTLSYELKEWRLKRITYDTVESLFNKLQRGNDGRLNDSRAPRALRDWGSFIEMNALDLLQQMDCVPWGLASELNYEAQLGIDVGWDRRHFALSLLICRPETRKPAFWLDTVVEVKADSKFETINEVHLRDKIVELFKRSRQKYFDPLGSVLALRDGRESGKELEAIVAAQKELMMLGILEKGAKMDVVDLHKRSVKGIRIWDRSTQGSVQHALEGSVVFLDERTVIIANTGAATLHQGTAEPLMLVARSDNINMSNVAQDVHATTHLNWSSPGAAQRLPLVLKRTDDELENRAAQEIRRIR